MIERQIIWLNRPLYSRFMSSLFSLNIKASEIEEPSYFRYTAQVCGKSVYLEPDDRDVMYIPTAWHTLKSDSVYIGMICDEHFFLTFTKIYLRTIRAIMEGKQGIIAFDLLSIKNIRMMDIFEKAVEEVFGKARETLVIYSNLGRSDDSQRDEIWDSYLEYRGITEKDWELGF